MFWIVAAALVMLKMDNSVRQEEVELKIVSRIQNIEGGR